MIVPPLESELNGAVRANEVSGENATAIGAELAVRIEGVGSHPEEAIPDARAGFDIHFARRAMGVFGEAQERIQVEGIERRAGIATRINTKRLILIIGHQHQRSIEGKRGRRITSSNVKAPAAALVLRSRVEEQALARPFSVADGYGDDRPGAERRVLRAARFSRRRAG
jgi:hypothetical protein